MGLQEKHRCSAWGSRYAVTLEAIIQPPAATIVRLRLNGESHRLFSLASFQQLNRDRCSRCFFASPRGVFLDVDDLAYRPSTAHFKLGDRTRASARACGQCLGYSVHHRGDHWCGLAAVGMKSKRHARLATLAWCRRSKRTALTAPVIENGRGS